MIPLTVGAEFDVVSAVSPNQYVWSLRYAGLAPSDGGFFL
jgi:hypothetical protein